MRQRQSTSSNARSWAGVGRDFLLIGLATADRSIGSIPPDRQETGNRTWLKPTYALPLPLKRRGLRRAKALYCQERTGYRALAAIGVLGGRELVRFRPEHRRSTHLLYFRAFTWE